MGPPRSVSISRAYLFPVRGWASDYSMECTGCDLLDDDRLAEHACTSVVALSVLHGARMIRP